MTTAKEIQDGAEAAWAKMIHDHPEVALSLALIPERIATVKLAFTLGFTYGVK